MVVTMIGSGAGSAAASPPRPDLVVLKRPSVAGLFSLGSEITVKDVVRNRGRRRARRSVVRYYLSLDRKRTRDDVRLAGRRRVKALKAWRRSRGRVTLVIPPDRAAGKHWLIACADDKRRVREVRERNNCRPSGAFALLAPGLGRPGPTPGPTDPESSPAPGPGRDPSAPTNGDSDGDGTPDDGDCAPLDGAVHPGATDEPDSGYVDADCDGIDGTASEAIFVATYGSDADPGTREQPKRSANAGVAEAIAKGLSEVYVARGTYDETLEVKDGVSVYGGYETDWTRSGAASTQFADEPNPTGASEGAVAIAITRPTTLQSLTLAPRQSTTPGASSYGLRIVNGPALIVEDVRAIGAPGQAGAHGDDGDDGANGNNGENATCTFGGPRAAGGSGGAPGHGGGRGGLGGNIDGDGQGETGESGRIVGAGGGAGGVGGAEGTSGGRGMPGAIGASGADGAYGLGGSGGSASSAWSTASGVSGAPGGHGHGGGGGGGGGVSGNGADVDSYGQRGGGGGGGGAGGGAGTGGDGGGGSFGVYVADSPGAVIRDSSVAAADGGAGGAGGSGGGGGNGALGGLGKSANDPGCTSGGSAGNGGHGGFGGAGGGGGGGAGGPSIAFYTHGPAVATQDNTLAFGTGGPGGNGPVNFPVNNDGERGLAAATASS